jgi:arylsulfatase A-like enzyme
LAARADALSDPTYGRLYPSGAPGGLRGDPEVHKTEAALRFIEESREEPFFLWLSYLNPHTPYVAVQQFLDLYANREIPEPVVESAGLAAAGKPFRQLFHQRNNDAVMPFDRDTVMQMRRVYFAMVSLIDAEVGRIVDHLDRLGLTNHTLIIFTSDHGDYMGDHGLITKSPALYDCLVRVPFIVRQPGVIEAGERRRDFVSHVDILPTLVRLAGGSAPDGVQGKDFLERRGLELRPAAYGEYGIPGLPYDEWSLQQAGYSEKTFTNPGDDRLPWEGNPVALSGPIRMVRTDRWKLIEEPGGTDELYDLQNDPHELVNLAGRPQVGPELRALRSILDQTND